MTAGAEAETPWWRDRICLAWIALALCLRVAYAWNLSGLEQSDPREYDAMAWNVAEGVGFTNRGYAENESWTRRPPLFVFFVAGVYRVFGHDVFAARMAQCLLGTLLCAATVGLAAELRPLRTVRAVAAVAALHPYLVYYSGYLMAETLATLLFTLVLWVLARGRPGNRSAALAGVVLGLAALTRSSYLGFAAPLFLWLRDALGSWRRAVVATAALALGASLAVTPWLVRNYVVTGRVVPIQETSVWGFYQYHLWFSQDDFPTFDASDEHTSWQRFEGRSRELFHELKTVPAEDQDAYFRSAAIRYVAEDPVRYLRSCFRKFLWLWRPSSEARAGSAVIGKAAFWVSLVSYTVWLPFFVVGLWRLARGEPRGRLLVWAVVYVTALHTFYWYGAPRFRFPIYPVFIIAVLVALEGLWETLRPRSPRVDRVATGC